MFVSATMSTDLITIGPKEKLSVVWQAMTENNIRHIPVVDDDDNLIGIVSDRDMRDAMPSKLLPQDEYNASYEKLMEHRVEEIMTPDPTTISVYFTLQDTLIIMGRKKKVGALPVVDEAGKLRGIMSTRDLMSAFVNIMGIGDPGSLLCILVEEKYGQMKKIIDIVTEEKVSLGSVLVAKYWDKEKRAVFPYLLTHNVATIKAKLIEQGFDLFDPMKWYFDHLPKKTD
nr:CBS domain-containing protein [uncultured Desulfobacter sp.]